MPMTREQRLELLKLAREAKAKKKLERDAGGDKPVVKRSRKPKEVAIEEPMEPVVEEPEVEPEPVESEPEIVEPVKKPRAARSKKAVVKEPVKTLELNNDIDVEDDVMVEEIVEIRKKPKKKIVKKIIYESCSEDEVEEVVVQNKPKKAAAKVKKIAKPVPLEAPKEVEVKPSFSFFNC